MPLVLQRKMPRSGQTSKPSGYNKIGTELFIRPDFALLGSTQKMKAPNSADFINNSAGDANALSDAVLHAA